MYIKEMANKYRFIDERVKKKLPVICLTALQIKKFRKFSLGFKMQCKNKALDVHFLQKHSKASFSHQAPLTLCRPVT